VAQPDFTLQTGKGYILLAFPDECGRWRLVSAEAEIVEGLYHKLTFPGFETRSGAGFGLTATPHVTDGAEWDQGRLRGIIRKVVLKQPWNDFRVAT
jgi:hypothetical protein